MPDINYPYMPEGRCLKYAPADSPFMVEAARAREECAGDPQYPVGCALVRDGVVLAVAGNGFNKGPGLVHICPRLVLECPSGTGYDLCTLHDAPGHAEHMVLDAALKAGIDPKGADVYMYGHWWACEPCWKAMIEAGIRDVYVTDDAHVRFSRDNVFAETMKPSIRSVYISGALTNLPEPAKDAHKAYYESLARAAEELGLSAYVPHLHSDPERHPDMNIHDVFDLDYRKISEIDAMVSDLTYPSLGTGGELMIAYQSKQPLVILSKKGVQVSRFALGNPAVVYHIKYDTYADACRMLRNVLKQL